MKQFFLFFMIVFATTVSAQQQKAPLPTLAGFRASDLVKLKVGEATKGVCYLDRPQQNINRILSGTYIMILGDDGKATKQPMPGSMYTSRPAEWNLEFFNEPMDQNGNYITPKPIACLVERTANGYELMLQFGL